MRLKRASACWKVQYFCCFKTKVTFSLIMAYLNVISLLKGEKTQKKQYMKTTANNPPIPKRKQQTHNKTRKRVCKLNQIWTFKSTDKRWPQINTECCRTTRKCRYLLSWKQFLAPLYPIGLSWGFHSLLAGIYREDRNVSFFHQLCNLNRKITIHYHCLAAFYLII